MDLGPSPNLATVEHCRRALMDHFPSLGEVRIERSWAGIVDTLPDRVPVLGESGLGGFLFATGFSGHGFAMGPIVGKPMAELIVEGRTPLDIAPLRFPRFAEGRPHPARPLRQAGWEWRACERSKIKEQCAETRPPGLP